MEVQTRVGGHHVAGHCDIANRVIWEMFVGRGSAAKDVPRDLADKIATLQAERSHHLSELGHPPTFKEFKVVNSLVRSGSSSACGVSGEGDRFGGLFISKPMAVASRSGIWMNSKSTCLQRSIKEGCLVLSYCLWATATLVVLWPAETTRYVFIRARSPHRPHKFSVFVS